MEATRGAALSSAPTGNPIVPGSILGAAHAAVAARRAARHERAAALGRLGEAAGAGLADLINQPATGRGGAAAFTCDIELAALSSARSTQPHEFD